MVKGLRAYLGRKIAESVGFELLIRCFVLCLIMKINVIVVFIMFRKVKPLNY